MVVQNVSEASEGEAEILSPGTTLLRGQYMIEQPLMRGGFGVTYLACDSLERDVVVKECFPRGMCYRVGERIQPVSQQYSRRYRSMLNHFLREARRLAALTHPNIVGVHQVFEENNTAYMALDLVEGDDLMTVALENPKRLTPRLIRDSLCTVLEAVGYIHSQGILHRDVSPDNILIGPDGHITLIDFGAAREQAGRESRLLTEILAVKDGYSPQEFYRRDIAPMASGDLYSIGATFYRLITGEAPPHSQDRMAALAARNTDPCVPLVGRVRGYPQAFLALIDQAMSVLPEDRMQSADIWLDGIRRSPGRKATRLKPGRNVELQRQISCLVETTNEEVDRRPSRPATPRISGRVPESRQPVDLFGDPIHDVDAWLKEQEAKSQPPETSMPSAASSETAQRPAGGLLSRGLSVFRKG